VPFTRPDVLVLAGGGLIGEAWMTGVLAGMEAASGLPMDGPQLGDQLVRML